MSTERGYPARFKERTDTKAIPLGATWLNLTEEETGTLKNACEAALREWDDERAQDLFTIIEDEQVRNPNPEADA